MRFLETLVSEDAVQEADDNKTKLATGADDAEGKTPEDKADPTDGGGEKPPADDAGDPGEDDPGEEDPPADDEEDPPADDSGGTDDPPLDDSGSDDPNGPDSGLPAQDATEDPATAARKVALFARFESLSSLADETRDGIERFREQNLADRKLCAVLRQVSKHVEDVSEKCSATMAGLFASKKYEELFYIYQALESSLSAACEILTAATAKTAEDEK
jgi:hypothetical protein